MPLESDLKEKVRAAHVLAEKASAGGYLDFLQYAVIDSRPEPRPFRELAQPWQWALAQRFAPAFEYVAKVRTDLPGPKNYFSCLAKGSDKTSSIARGINWTLAFCRQPFVGYVCAADKEQASLLWEAAQAEASLNPWYDGRLSFKNWEARGVYGSWIKVLASDAAGSQGIRGDLIIADEITHWKDDEMWKSIVSGLRKRPAVFIVLTNSGVLQTWQHKVYQLARDSPRWFFYHAPGRLPAPWMDEEAIKEDRRLLPVGMASRLFDNVWTPQDDSGYLTLAECLACADLGMSLGLFERDTPAPGVLNHYAAIDFGSVKDRCVCTLVHVDAAKRVIVDRMAVRQGSREHPVPIAWVEDWLSGVALKFPLACVVLDPYQMEGTIQRFEGKLPVERWKARGGAENHKMAEVLRTLVVNRKVAWYPGCGDLLLPVSGVSAGRVHTLADELSELIIQPYSNGTSYRMQHLPGNHDDRSVCLAMACVACLKGEEKIKLYHGTDFW